MGAILRYVQRVLLLVCCRHRSHIASVRMGGLQRQRRRGMVSDGSCHIVSRRGDIGACTLVVLLLEEIEVETPVLFYHGRCRVCPRPPKQGTRVGALGMAI
jgi:hypothetical protein